MEIVYCKKCRKIKMLKYTDGETTEENLFEEELWCKCKLEGELPSPEYQEEGR